MNIDNSKIDAGGILFEVDREFLFDYGYLHNQYVQIQVDRLSVDFIGCYKKTWWRQLKPSEFEQKICLDK